MHLHVALGALATLSPMLTVEATIVSSPLCQGTSNDFLSRAGPGGPYNRDALYRNFFQAPAEKCKSRGFGWSWTNQQVSDTNHASLERTCTDGSGNFEPFCAGNAGYAEFVVNSFEECACNCYQAFSTFSTSSVSRDACTAFQTRANPADASGNSILCMLEHTDEVSRVNNMDQTNRERNCQAVPFPGHGCYVRQCVGAHKLQPSYQANQVD